MKKLIFISLIISSFANADGIQERCDNDQSGEIYSRLYDADSIETNLEDLGLDGYAEPYKSLIAENPDLDIFDFVMKFGKKYPVLEKKLNELLKEECEERIEEHG